MISLATKQLNASIGVVITASHNPPSYNGYKLKASFGGPLLQKEISEIENLIDDKFYDDLSDISLENNDKYKIVDIEKLYYDEVVKNFDIDLINDSNLKLAYDAMYGSGMFVAKRILSNAKFLHCDWNPSFGNIAPEPIHRNLSEFSQFIVENKIDCGLATDGDADRIGLYNSKGEFIDAHHIILLVIHYLVKYKKMSGKVVTAFSCSVKVKKLCEFYNLEHETVKIGFKHIAGKMVTEDVLLGGEESGGIAIKGHVPERDGIWIGLLLFEYMASSGKSLDDLINEVYDIVGSFSFERIDLHLDNKKKEDVIEKCQNDQFKSFGEFNVKKIEKTDGYKFFFNDDTWLMIRPSGTEPVLRTYSEAPSRDIALKILESAQSEIL
tara:strand:+ start:1 stop:1146 length:1146 start_codon:yes stop_codon:yes gene_type:complete